MDRALLPPDPIAALTDALQTHPRFEAAALYYFDNVMEWRREIGWINAMISTYARNIIIAYVCFLHFANETGVPEGGATFGRIWELVNRRGDCGSRSLRTVLGIASLAGYLSKVPGAHDRRAHAYVPTTKLLSHYAHHLANTLRCFDILLDDKVFAEMTAKAPDFMGRIMRSSGKAAIQHDITFAEQDPLLLRFAHMSGGLATLYAVANADMRKAPLPTSAAIGRKYKISVSQIRAVFAEAQASGLLRLDEAGGLIDGTGCTRIIKILLARELALYAKFTLGLEQRLSAHQA